jgi:hypothetical protein
MELDVNLTPKNYDKESLYMVALNCAWQHNKTNCGNKPEACQKCNYNAYNYGYDPNEVKLLYGRANYAISIHPFNTRGEWKSMGGLIIMLILIVLIGKFAFGMIPKQLAPYYVDPPFNAEEVFGTYTTQQVRDSIQRTRLTLRDVNSDGEIDCIDWAVRFYEIHRGAKIYHCYYGVYGDQFTHLLNRVGDKYIEPQQYSGERMDVGDPFQLWGGLFTRSYKDNVTAMYAKYATRKEW